jgi:SAM-dependent methyltransferase
MSAFKNDFSKQAPEYARYRPSYPPSLIGFIATLAPGRRLAWDCATGSGQAALALAGHFDSVHATDPSAEQIKQAPPHPKVRYAVESAEACSLPDASVDLVTCAQALHWFRHDEFFAQVKRVLRPGGAFAAWTYWECRLPDAALTARVDRFMKIDLAPYWAPEVKLRFEGNRAIAIPLEPIDCPPFVLAVDWNFSQFLGYLRSWSGVQRCVDATGQDPLAALAEELRPLWPAPSERKRVTWDVLLRAGRLA